MHELDKNITLLIAAQVNGTANQSELKELQQWLESEPSHKIIYSEVKAIMLKKPIAPNKQKTEIEFSKLEKRITSLENESLVKTKKLKTTFPLRIVAGIAASIILILTLYLSIDKNWESNPTIATITKSCAKGQKLHLSLSDGTEVWLNADSHVTFPKHFAENNRNITLKGEAFFKVAKNENKPFVVKTFNSEIKVLGTSFNVRNSSIDNFTETTVVSGKVLVSSTFKSQSVTLVKNQYALVDTKGNLLKEDNINIESIIDWKDNNLFFNDIPLSEVFKEIEPWFDIEIIVEDDILLQKKLRAKFTNPSLNQLLEYTSKVMGFDYHIEGKTVTIIKQN